MVTFCAAVGKIMIWASFGSFVSWYCCSQFVRLVKFQFSYARGSLRYLLVREGLYSQCCFFNSFGGALVPNPAAVTTYDDYIPVGEIPIDYKSEKKGIGKPPWVCLDSKELHLIPLSSAF